MRSYRDDVVVLRQHKLGEADYILTLLTREHGLVRAVAKGIRRTRSRFGGRIDLFGHADVQLYPGRNLDTVITVHEAADWAGRLSDDYARYTTACAIAETAERLGGEERIPNARLYRLTVAALKAVAVGSRDRELLLLSYLLRATEIAGFSPALEHCARCGEEAEPGGHRAFHIAAGGAVCVYCRPAGSTLPAPGVIDLMIALRRSDFGFAEQSTRTVRSQAQGLVSAHLQWHLERQLRSLPLLDRNGPDRNNEAARGVSDAHSQEAAG